MFWKILGIALLVVLFIVLLFIAMLVGALGILFILGKAADEAGPEEFADKIYKEVKPSQLNEIAPYFIALGKRFTPEDKPVKKTTKKKTILNESKKK